MSKKPEIQKPEIQKSKIKNSAQPNKPDEPELRLQAEAALERAPQQDDSARSAEELLHELRVHRIELEMQNETLRESQLALEKSRDHYADLYEFSPVGYITLARDAIISDINLTGATLLGEQRNKLIRRRFSTLVAAEDRDLWHRIFMHALHHDEYQKCELKLQHGDGSLFLAKLEGLHRIEKDAAPMVRFTFTDVTRLNESEQRYRMLFEQATDGIVITDAETGEIIELNQALADMVVRNKAELIGKPLHFICPPETGDSACNMLLQQHARKHGAKIETQLLDSSGKIHQVEIKLSVMTMNGREVEFGIVRDVTERHHAQAREYRLRHILDNTLDMIFIFAPHTLNFVYANKGACKAIGYSQDEILRMSLLEVIPLISEPEGRAFLAPLASGKKTTMRFETTLKRKDGKIFPVEAQLQFVKDDGGNGLFVAIGRDNTRRKLAEDDLRRQKNLMWQVIDMDPNMIFVRNEAGRFLLANQAIADYYGVKITKLIGTTDRELKPEPHKDTGFLVSDREVIASGREITSTEAASMPDGRLHWYLTVKRPIPQADGSVDILGIATDISELKQSGIMLDESYKELQRLSLHLESIRAEERTQIARNLHDEMGATLAALKMRVAWLASKLPADMPLLAKELGHISELVSEGIHTVRKVVSDLRPNLLDDVGLIAAVKDYVKRFQHDTEIECSLVLPQQDLNLNEDQSVTVFRIVQESLSNVAHHAQAGKVEVLFKLQDEALLIKIQDNGIGFEPINKERSFGLLGIKERARMIGGSATVESRQGLGTQVSLIIPYPHTRPLSAQSVLNNT